MKKNIGFLCALLSATLLIPFWPATLPAGGLPGAGALLPRFSLPVPASDAHRAYLGLTGAGRFDISQIRTQVVVIEIFSMYCPYCQAEAPVINRLYDKIEKSPDLKGKIKLIGIGAGNSSFEVDVFRKKYHVPFPLFADENFAIHKCLGESKTPAFFGVRIEDHGMPRVFHAQLGRLKSIDGFLETIIKRSKLR